jgi:glycopeptide antibiotics resistance protein
MSRTITIRRPVTIFLLLLVTVAIVLITLYTSGKSYSKVDPRPFEDLRHLAKLLTSQGRQVSMHTVAVIVVPIVANVLLFVPFGFLLFIALYTIERPTMQTYVLTVLLGLTFTCAVEAWQYFLPSRVADVNDIIWNTLGAFGGAILGHLRERVRFEFA